MEENKDNVIPLPAKTVPEAPLTADEQSATRTRGQAVSDHLDEHKAKYIAGLILSTLLALLQAWPSICPALPGKLSCAQSQTKVDAAKATIQVIKQLDATGGGDATP